MNRTLTVLAAALAALTLVILGCDGGGTSAPKARLTFWHIQTNTATRQVVEEAVGAYEDQSGGVLVQTSVFENDPYKQKLSQAMASGEMPDVFHTWGGGGLAEFVREGKAADITALAAADNITQRILPAALRFCTVDGKHYAVPMDVSAAVMWYNRDLFAKHGVAVPETWEGLLAACDKLRKAGVTPIALGNKDAWPGAFYFVYLAARIGGTQPFDDAASRAPGPGAPGFAGPSFVEAGRRLQELVRAGAFNPGIDVMAYKDARGLFFREQAAMILMGTWFLADAKAAAPQMLDKIDCFPFPAVTAGEAGGLGVVVGGVNSAYAVSSACLQPARAVKLLGTLTSDVVEARWGATGRIPALRQDLLSGMIPPASQKAAGILFSAPAVQLYYDQALPRQLAEQHKRTTQSLISLTTTPEEAAQAMEATAAETLRSGAPRETAGK